MILCNSPVPILRMAEYGYQVPYITVGNMATKPGAVQVKKTVFVSPEEKEAFVKLIGRGVTVYSQMVPNEPREDISDILKKL